jgi:hypothetical protein
MSHDQKQEPRTMSMFTPNRKENSTHIGGTTDLTPDKGLLQILNQIDYTYTHEHRLHSQALGINITVLWRVTSAAKTNRTVSPVRNLILHRAVFFTFMIVKNALSKSDYTQSPCFTP